MFPLPSSDVSRNTVLSQTQTLKRKRVVWVYQPTGQNTSKAFSSEKLASNELIVLVKCNQARVSKWI